MGQKSSSTLNINTDSSALNNPIMNVNDIKMKTIEENNNSNSNSNNNSNNTYTKSAIEVLSINRFTTDSYSSEIDQKKDYSFKYGPKSNNDYKLLFVFFACNYFWTLIMTAVPVLCNLKPQHYYDPKNDNLSPSQGTNDWYSASDVMRLVEPLVGLPFQLILFLCSGIFEKWDNDIFTKILILIWIFSASIYGQGAGFHSASNMFKNALESYINPDDSYDDNLIPLYYYMRTVWEHNYSHYMYACGYAGMQICCCIAYSDKIQDTSSKFDFQTISFFFLSACIYGYDFILILIYFYKFMIIYYYKKFIIDGSCC